jgi:hypothetical protein
MRLIIPWFPVWLTSPARTEGIAPLSAFEIDPSDSPNMDAAWLMVFGVTRDINELTMLSAIK